MDGDNEGTDSNFDPVLKMIGGFGKFQVINILCICSLVMLCSFGELSYVFTAGEIKHRCLIEECEGPDSKYEDMDKPWLSAAVPRTTANVYNSCLRFKHNNSESCDPGSFYNETITCDTFVFKTEEWTIVREDWGLQCQRYKLTLVGFLNNLGQVAGSPIVGYLADKYGRKVVVTMALIVTVIGLIKSFSVNYAMMLTLEILQASVAVALFNLPFVLGVEIVDPSKRVLAGILIDMAYPLGEMVLGMIQYLTFEWRTTLRILYAPYLLTIAYYWILPESARWLLDNERPDEALAILRKIAETNKKPFPESEVQKVLNETTKEGARGDEKYSKISLKDIVRSKIMRNRLAVTYFVWIVNVFLYFGLTLNSVSLSSNKFLNYIFTTLIEMPAYIVLYFVLDRYGRKICQPTALLICGLCCLLDAFVPEEDSWSWAKLSLYLIGKFGCSTSLLTLYVFTTELFPTPLRSTIIATSLMVAKIATALAPEVPLLSDIYEPLPLLLFGVLAAAAGFTSLTFPETLGSKLPNTIEEAETLGKISEEKEINASL